MYKNIVRLNGYHENKILELYFRYMIKIMIKIDDKVIVI